MSHSSTHALSTRLFVQAAVTGLLAPLTKGGSTWLVITFAVAAGAVGVAMLLRSNPANAKVAVVGYEAVAVAVGAVGIAGGHYIPGTIVGIVTLIAALNMHAVAAPDADADAQSDSELPAMDAPPMAAPPMIAPAMSAPGMAAPEMAAPVMGLPVMDNPYAPPAAVMGPPAAVMAPPPAMAPPAPIMPAPAPAMASPAPVVPDGPVMAPPAPVVPQQAVAPEPSAPDETDEVAAPDVDAPKLADLEVPAAEITQPLRPEDIPPAQRALTILPGR